MEIEIERVYGTSLFTFILLLILLLCTMFVLWRFVWRPLKNHFTPPKLFGTLTFLSGPLGKDLPSPIPLHRGRQKTIGSSATCDIVLPEDVGVEAEHAQLYVVKERQRSQMYIKSLKGKVLLVNYDGSEEDIYAEPRKLKRGSTFKIGEYLIYWA